jgi:hypothetical protein
MIDVVLPFGEDVTAVTSFAACLASMTETPLDQVPPSAGELPDAIGQWRGWLAGRGAGLAPIADAARFNWPGYWIAVLDEIPGSGAGQQPVVLMFGTPAGVVLSPSSPSSSAERHWICRSGTVICSPR